jgi:hypothetical protein
MSLYVDVNAPIYISITSIGVVFNLISFGVFSRKKFQKNNVRNMFRVSLVAETFTLLLNINIFQISTYFCKIYVSLSYILPAYTAWILVFISLERYFSIVFYKRKIAEYFSNKIYQMMSLIFLLVICIFFYCPIWINYELKYASLVNNSYYIYSDVFTDQIITTCYIDPNIYIVSSFINAFFSTIIPFFILITLSVMLIYSMWILRKRIATATSRNAKALARRSRRDFHFACSILFLDILFFLLYFPNGIYLILESNFPYFRDISFYYLKITLAYLYQSSAATSIFVYFFFNKIFRSELFIILKNIENYFIGPL